MSIKSYTESLLKDIEENENASFNLENREGKAFLIINPPGIHGKPVNPEDVLARIRLFGIEGFKIDEIKKIVKESSGKAAEIGIWKGGHPEDAATEVIIAEDKMQASLYITPPKHGGKNPGIDTFNDLLLKAGVTFGIDRNQLLQLEQNPVYHSRIVVASGEAPRPGKNGYIKYHFNVHGIPDLKEDSSGRVDFKNISVVKSVKQNDLLAEMVPSEQGTNGHTVTGEIIAPPQSPEAVWKLGHGCRLSTDKKQLFSEISGRPILERNNTIRVDEICYLENVDFSTGNVDFIGTIVVDGTVADDFKLETQGSIIIKKSVGRVFLKAGGDIILSGGVMGKNGGMIQSDSDIYAKFIEQGRLVASGSIFIEEASMHSDLIAGDSVQVLGGRGEIIGGEIIAGRNIICNKLGAIVETKTKVMAGTPPEVINELEKIKADLKNKKDTLFKIQQSLNKLSEEAARRDLSEEDVQILEKLNLLKDKYSSIVISLTNQYENALSWYEPALDSFVLAEKVIFPGVEINLGNGKIAKYSLREIQGKSYVYIGHNGMVTQTSHPPPKKKKSL